jgi:ADP-ribose pyrophosphatase YjhB (NUDIX family)
MSGKAVIVRQRRVFDDCFKIDELLVKHEQIDGTMSAVQKRLVFERGDSIAVLLLHVERKSVVLVEQFKVPALVARRRDDPSTNNGWIVETVAGMIDADETPEAAAIRETFEETGTSERVFLYFAEISDTDRAGQGGGIGDEDIKVVQMGLDELFARLARGSIEDPKLLIAAYWLQNG